MFLYVRVTRAWSPTGLIPWFSKTEGNTYTTLLHHPFLFKGKPTHCSRGSKVEALQERIHTLKKKHKLVDVVDVMLHRYILPLQDVVAS